MSEENSIDPAQEAKRIVSKYFMSLAVARQNIDWAASKMVLSRDKEMDIRHAEEGELDVDELFGQEVDRWRHDGTEVAKSVLIEIVKLLEHRPGITYFGKQMLNRLKDEIHYR